VLTVENNISYLLTYLLNIWRYIVLRYKELTDLATCRLANICSCIGVAAGRQRGPTEDWDPSRLRCRDRNITFYCTCRLSNTDRNGCVLRRISLALTLCLWLCLRHIASLTVATPRAIIRHRPATHGRPL